MAQQQKDPLARVMKHLDEGSSPADQAAACATMTILLNQPNPPPSSSLDGLCEKLLRILNTAEDGVKPNAIAAFSAAVEVSEQFCKDAVQGNAAQKLVPLLTNSTTATTSSTENNSEGYSRQLIINAISALGGLGEATEEGLQSVLAAGGLPAIIAFCSPEQDPIIQEAAVDSICKLMSSASSAKEEARTHNVVPALASLLTTDYNKNAEVTVRALIGLAMAVGDSEDAQVQLAKAPGAVQELLALMRSPMDGDSQHIAAALFSGLAQSPAAKEAMAEAMRQNQ